MIDLGGGVKWLCFVSYLITLLLILIKHMCLWFISFCNACDAIKSKHTSIPSIKNMQIPCNKTRLNLFIIFLITSNT